jgi:hypothetical protein
VWEPPALTAAKFPPDSDAWPERFEPQQATLPLVLIPQLWLPPALTARKVPPGGLAWPKPFAPQQASVPFVRIAHV